MRHSGSDVRQKNGPALAIFDFDGTLADTWDWMADELVEGAGPLGYKQTTRAELEKLRSLNTREVLKALHVPWWRVPRLAAHLRNRAIAKADKMRLFEGVPELLEALHRRGVLLAIISSNPDTVVRRVLGDALTRLIDRVDCGASVFGKSAKIKRMVRRTGIAKADVVAIGDETRDVEAAQAAGIRGVFVEWGYADPALLRDLAPGRTVASVDKLADFLMNGAGPAAMPET